MFKQHSHVVNINCCRQKSSLCTR